MASYKIEHPKVHADKLAVFTSNDEINEIDVRCYFIKNWDTLTMGMDNSTRRQGNWDIMKIFRQ